MSDRRSTRAQQGSRLSDSKSQSSGSTSTSSQQSKQQHAFSAAGLPAQRSLHEDVVQFLAGFDGDSAATNSKHTAQVEELVNAVSHQLPSYCFWMSSEDNPLLRGVGAQFEQRGPGEPSA